LEHSELDKTAPEPTVAVVARDAGDGAEEALAPVASEALPTERGGGGEEAADGSSPKK
jgi:hypothetical protein